MRGLIRGLPSPHPMGARLPALYQEDALGQRLTAAFDESIAPILATLDNLEAYLDPELTPSDFLEWLGSWLGIAVDETWELERRRRAIASAVEIYRLRGTVEGLVAQIEVSTGGTVEIVENGAAGWSGTSGTPLPGNAQPSLLVTIAVEDPDAIDQPTLDALIRAAKPAHLPHDIEILKR
jgi:phage tail-like protein